MVLPPSTLLEIDFNRLFETVTPQRTSSCCWAVVTRATRNTSDEPDINAPSDILGHSDGIFTIIHAIYATGQKIEVTEALSQSGHAPAKLAASGVVAVSLGHIVVPAVPIDLQNGFIEGEIKCI